MLGLACTNKNGVDISIRGTRDLKDVWTDVEPHGFQKRAAEVLKDGKIVEAIREAIEEGQKTGVKPTINIAGHSLGSSGIHVFDTLLQKYKDDVEWNKAIKETLDELIKMETHIHMSTHKFAKI